MGNIKNQLVSKLSPICFFTLVAWGQVSYAAITPSTPMAGGPSVSAGANGSTVININAAGKGGVSHNIYSQFDVDRAGAVLNNSAKDSKSQLAGDITGNANLAGGSASIILNEVNSAQASQLSGMIEVAGQKAQVIVANPSGITCSGCGFINTDRATLTTGKPQVVNGSLLGYTVEKGTIVVNGDGLKTADANYTNLISRAVKINSEIHAKDLKVTVGRNRVNAENTQIDTLSPGGVKPSVAIDVSRLGGMYANKITMVSTDSGVGVSNAGTIGADLSNVNISTDGMVTNRGDITAKNDITLDTTRGRQSNNGYYNYSGQTLDNSANGTIKADHDININIARSKLSNGGGIIQSKGDINIVSGNIDNKYGNIQSTGAIDMHHDIFQNDNNRTIINSGGVISGSEGVKISYYALDNTNGKVEADTGGINIETGVALLNNSKGTIEACCEINLNTGTLYNKTGLIQSTKDLTINTAKMRLDNTGGVIRASNDMYIKSAGLTNTSERIAADNYLDMNISGGMISNTGLVKDTYDAGIFSGAGGMKLTASSILNSTGYIASKGDIDASVVSSFSNTGGLIESNKNILINTGTFNNNNGKVKADEDMLINASSTMTNSINSMGGSFIADGNAILQLATSYLNYGTLNGKKGVNILAPKGVVYNYGNISSENGVVGINAVSFYNEAKGTIHSPSGVQVVLAKTGMYQNKGSIDGEVKVANQ